MLRLSLPTLEVWNPDKEVFELIGGDTVEFEHSLYTIAGWEAKWETPFAKKEGLTHEQLMDYIRTFMCQTEISKTSWLTINQETIDKIREYMESSQSGTTIHRNNIAGKGKRHETVTAELIYFYMAQFGIPFECEHWHLNRLMTLIDVSAIKSSPPKKMGRRDAFAHQRSMNAKRRSKTGSRG